MAAQPLEAGVGQFKLRQRTLIVALGFGDEALDEMPLHDERRDARFPGPLERRRGETRGAAESAALQGQAREEQVADRDFDRQSRVGERGPRSTTPSCRFRVPAASVQNDGPIEVDKRL